MKNRIRSLAKALFIIFSPPRPNSVVELRLRHNFIIIREATTRTRTHHLRSRRGQLSSLDVFLNSIEQELKYYVKNIVACHKNGICEDQKALLFPQHNHHYHLPDENQVDVERMLTESPPVEVHGPCGSCVILCRRTPPPPESSSCPYNIETVTK